MLKPVSNRNTSLACSADCPADNHARQLALFLYGTLANIIKTTIAIFTILLTVSFKAAACECPEYGLTELDNESYEWSDVIVIGNVVKTGTDYSIKVTELLKGNTEGSVLNGTIFGEDDIFNSCSDFPNEKGEYLFYLKKTRKKGKTYYLYSQCLGTRKLDFGSVVIPLRTEKSKSELVAQTADWIQELRKRRK